MSEPTIRAALKSIVTTTAGASAQVHDYERWAADWATFLSLYKKVDKINGWHITCTSVEATQQGFGGFHLYDHRYTIRGYYSLDDSAATEKTFLAVAIALAKAINDADTIEVNQRSITSPASLNTFEPRVFGSVLCHYAEINVTVAENG